MKITGQTPPVERRAASVALPPKPPEIKRATRVWTPSKHGWVITTCGHVTADDSEVRAFGALAKEFKAKVWCDRCKAPVKILRKAKATEVVGILPLQISGIDAPPF